MPVTFAPYAAAVDRLGRKTPIAATLTSEEWAAVPLALRERAFFSAQVAKAETVAKLKAALDQALKLEGDTFMDKAKFVAVMRRELGAPEGDTGSLTDLASGRRLGLIYKQNIESAREYGRWKAGQAPELRDAYPAQELLRVESREVERDWGMRWANAGGQFYGPDNRMIALKGDPVWTRISRFGTPWPPFDFNSGMGVEDVSREEAEALGVIAPGAAAPEAEELDLNDGLSATVGPEAQAEMKRLFGDDITFVGDRAQWTPNRLVDLWRMAAVDGPKPAFGEADRVGLGQASGEAVAAARRDLGIDITDWRLEVRAEDLWHAWKRHGKDGTKGGDQVSLTEAEARAVAVIWRSPQTLRWSAEGRTAPGGVPPPEGWRSAQFQIAADLGNGWQVMGNYVADPATRILRLGTIWKKKTGVAP